MNRALLKLSMDVIAKHFFGDQVKVVASHLDSDDTRYGTVTLLIEGDGLPPMPPEGQKYSEVSAEITEHVDEKNLVPSRHTTVRFVKVP
jgi:hypothetical protein